MGDIHSFAYVDPTAQVLDPQLSVFTNPRAISIGAHSRVDGMVKLEGGQGIKIGSFVHIASFSHINAGGGEVIFGDHSGCSSHVVICSGQPDLSYLHISAADDPADRHPIRMKTVIGEHVVIFAGAVICPGVTIGNGAVIGAGAVVTHDVPEMAIMAGVPAIRIGTRKIRSRGDALPVDEYTALALARLGVRG
jgi:acetyltransferase-like isoleucine patch superfamily enzyme